MYFVYVIYNQDFSKIYIGQTIDLAERVRLHNNGTFKTSFTSRFKGVWKLIYKEEFNNRHEALKREKQLKSYQGRKFIKKHIPL